jgi:hypothetical protein
MVWSDHLQRLILACTCCVCHPNQHNGGSFCNTDQHHRSPVRNTDGNRNADRDQHSIIQHERKVPVVERQRELFNSALVIFDMEVS